jgi:hypothetical protein
MVKAITHRAACVREDHPKIGRRDLLQIGVVVQRLFLTG